MQLLTLFVLSLCSAVAHGVPGLRSSITRQGHLQPEVNTLLKDDPAFIGFQPSPGNAVSVTQPLCPDWQGDLQGGIICDIENGEHKFVQAYLPPDAVVIEFGARFGTTSCEMAKKLQNNGNVVAVEPDRSVWEPLQANLKNHNCNVHLVKGVIGSHPVLVDKDSYGTRTRVSAGADVNETSPSYTLQEVEDTLGKKVDTLLIDCEGCGRHLMEDMADVIKTRIKLIILEADMPCGKGDAPKDNCMDYEPFFAELTSNGFKMIEKHNDCENAWTGSVKWCFGWIDHYVFQKEISPSPTSEHTLVEQEKTLGTAAPLLSLPLGYIESSFRSVWRYFGGFL